MHDIKTIRDNPAAFDQGLALRGLAAQSVELLKIDSEKRDHIQKLQDAQARRNALSKEIGEVMRAGDKAKAEILKAEVAGLKDVIASGEEAERLFTQKLNDALAVIPNIPMEGVPQGKDEHDNKELHTWGTKPTFKFEPRQHFDIGEWLGLMDFETAAKLSGARFVILKGQLAKLERALAQFMLDLHTGTNGYTEHFVPYLVNEQALYGTGQLPKFSEDLFKTEIFSRLQATDLFASEAHRLLHKQFEALKSTLISDKEMLKSLFSGVKTEEDLRAGISALIEEHWSQFLGTAADGGREAIGKLKLESQRWLIPTAEVSLTNLVRESTLDEKKLPLRLTAYTPCFRAEAGAAGKDTRGMIRQHQFTKVELVSITTPEQSRAELDRMTKCAESVLQKLGLHYRVMLLCTGDMGFGSQMTYDIEVWLPGQKAYREISSCSVCGDFQARRMEARFKPTDGKGPCYVHTLNGSGLAVGRTMVAILENYQNDDGSVTIPEVLRPYMGGADKITRGS